MIGLGVGALIGGTVAGVTAYNQGSRGWDLVGDILTGVGIGALIGSAVGAILGLSIPTFGSMIGGLAFAGGSSAISLSNAEIAIIGLAVVLSSTNRPRDNRKQNEQFRQVMRRLGYDKKDWQWRYGHDHLPNESLGFKDLLKFLTDLLNKFK